MSEGKCDQHEKLFGLVSRIDERTISIDKRINGSIDDIEKHIERGTSWRIGILGVAVGLIIQVIAFAYMYGQICQKVFSLEREVFASIVK